MTERERGAYLELVRASAGRALRSGGLRRADGRTVTCWVDGHFILGEPEALDAAGALIAEKAIDAEVDAVVGEVSAGTPLVAATLLAALRQGRRLVGRSIRREPKGYGVTGLFTTSMAGIRRALVVDDVAASGAAGVRSVRALESAGIVPVGMVVLVDRGEGAGERLQALGVSLTSLLTWDDLTAPPPGLGT